MQQAIERSAKEAGASMAQAPRCQWAPAKVTTSTKALADWSNNELARWLGDGRRCSRWRPAVTFGGGRPDRDRRRDRHVRREPRVSMSSGHATAEVAQAAIDEGVGRTRQMLPGNYAPVAMNIEGPGAEQGFPQELFDSADPRGWSEGTTTCRPPATRSSVPAGRCGSSGEGASIMIVEFYLPREGAR